MRSFALAAFAFLTLGAFSAAAPTPDVRDLAKLDARADTTTIVARGGSSSSSDTLDGVLTKLVTDLEVIITDISKFIPPRLRSTVTDIVPFSRPRVRGLHY